MKNRKFLVIAAVFAAVAMLFAGCGKQQDADVPNGMQLASSSEADYLFYVPEAWRVDQSTLYTSAYYSTGDATSMSVSAFGLQYNDSTVSDWWAGFTEQFEAVYDSMEVTGEEAVTMGGEEGMQYTFNAMLAEKSYQYVVTAAIHDGYVYYITYTSTPEFYEEHLSELNQAIEYFAFK